MPFFTVYLNLNAPGLKEHSSQLGLSRHIKGFVLPNALQIRALCSLERMFRIAMPIMGGSYIGVPTVPTK